MPDASIDKPEKKSSLAGRAAWLAFLTLISRFLGLARDMLMAWRFGAGMQADAFNFAFLIPNLLRRLLAEGAISVSLVPVFGSVNKKKGKEELAEIYRKAIGVYSVFLVIFLLVLLVALPFVAPYFVYGFSEEKRQLTVRLIQIMLPLIFFLALSSVSTALLHTFKMFTAPALAPIILNTVFILGILFLTPVFDMPIYGVAIAVSLSGAYILLLVMGRLAYAGVPLRPKFKWDPHLGEMLRLMGPALLGVMIYYINVLFSKFLASFLIEGSITYIYYSDRLFELPLGVIAVSVATVTLPELSAKTAQSELKDFRELLVSSVRLTLYVCIPAALGLFILREPLVKLLFQRGEFTPEDAAITATVFRNALPGLIFVAAIRVVIQAFYSLKKPSYAVYIAVIAFIVNAVASLLLIGPLGPAGLTLANSISSFVNITISLLIFGWLLKKLGAPEFKMVERAKLFSDIALMFAAAAIMAVAVYFGFHFAQALIDDSIIGLIVSMALLVGVGALIYFIVTKMLGLNETQKLTSIVLKKIKK